MMGQLQIKNRKTEIRIKRHQRNNKMRRKLLRRRLLKVRNS